jgi:hypothetical protein
MASSSRDQSAVVSLADARGAVNARDHHIIAELGDADRGLAVEAAVPTEPIRLVAGGPVNALGVFFDRGEQVVVAATVKRGGGQWHRGSPDDSPSIYGDRRDGMPRVQVQARETASAEGVGSPSGGRPSRGHGYARSCGETRPAVVAGTAPKSVARNASPATAHK